MLAPNTILNGRYRIVRQLGHGGMGAVYEAMNEPVSSLVALKETFATTEDQRDAFEREAKLLGNLDHDAFPRVMDHFFEGEGQYLVMELVRGNNLWELLQIREMPFAPEKVLEWADQLLDALHELHNHTPPIVHRDIKPPNIKLTPRGKIKLLDFGIAKGTAGEMTFGSGQPMSIIGFTPHFAPLEQTLRSDRRWVEALEVLNPEVVASILRSPTDPRSDIYSLGATLYHLMTNSVPSDAASRALAVWSGRPDPLRPANAINPQIPVRVAATLNRAMALDRNQRLPDASAMRQMLRDAAQPAASPVPGALPKDDPASVPTRVDPRAPTDGSAAKLDTDQQRQAAEAETRRMSDEQRWREAEEAARRLEAERRQREEEQRSRGRGDATIPSLPPVLPPPPSDPGAGAGYSKPRSSSKVKWVIFGGAALVVAWLLVVGTIAVVSLIKPGNGNTSTYPIFGGTPTPTPTPAPLVDMVYVPAGSFMMGSTSDDTNSSSDESPRHSVTLDGFYLGKYEVTQAQWNQLMHSNLTQLRDRTDTTTSITAVGDQYPIYWVSWDDAQKFIERLNARRDRFKYRLPTEAEWEYAARAGTTNPFAGDLDAMGWYKANSDNNVHVVGQKQANAWGLYDMHGNLWEWCEDFYQGDYYASSPATNPRGPATGTKRVGRGGCFAAELKNARSAYRGIFNLDDRGNLIGFRVAADLR